MQRWHSLTASSVLLFITSGHADPGAHRMDPPTDPLLRIEVRDESGQPVAGAEAFLIASANDMPLSAGWLKAGAHHTIDVRPVDLRSGMPAGAEPTRALAHVRAPGFAWATVTVLLPAEEPVTVSLPRGRSVTFDIVAPDGHALPDDYQPLLFTDGTAVAAWLTGTYWLGPTGPEARFQASVPRALGNGRYAWNVTDACTQVWVLTHHPGFLRSHQAGPFDVQAPHAAHRIELPSPATLEVHLSPKPDGAHEYSACTLSIGFSPDLPDLNWLFTIFAQEVAERAAVHTLNDLPPAMLVLYATTGERHLQYRSDRPDFYRAQQTVTLEAGERAAVSMHLETFDESALRARLRGDGAATATVMLSDGTPASGRAYELGYMLQQFGRTLKLHEGVIPEDGVIRVQNLAPSDQSNFLVLSVDGQDRATIFIDPKNPIVTVEVLLPPAVGDMAPDLVLTRVDDDRTFRLSDLRGKVVYLDFWASWCGPCQAPMARSDALAARRTDWNDRVIILGASIDDTMEAIRGHLARRGWKHVLQAFCDEGETGWNSPAVRRYAVRGVPTCFLIDRDGRITWTGHPASIDVEVEIDRLLVQ